jgi:dGTPase
MFAPFACQPDASRGRLWPERLSSFRSPYQRDRDRIIHSSAFHHLKHKTQTPTKHKNNHYRTHLTHTIEITQVTHTITGILGLNTDLAEAVALAHDLGHTPFGHTGEDAMERLMAPYGGFDHNAQALRIVTKLERHYADFDGLNLSWETLEGIAKHNGPVTGPNADKKHEGPLPYALAEVNAQWDLELDTHASAEAQVAAIADDVAYSHHDLHDGLRSGLFTEDDLMELPVTRPAFDEVDRLYPDLDRMRRRHEALRRVFGRMVEDVIAVAQNRLTSAQPKSVDDIRHMGTTIIRFSKPLYQDLKAVRSFLFHRMYRAPSVMAVRAEVTRMVDNLFPLFLRQPDLLPPEWQPDVAAALDEIQLARVVADYVAGMTDRFAIQEHARLFGTTPQPPI